MGFEEASKKYARLLLLVFGSFITGGLYFTPFLMDLNTESAKVLIESRENWMIIYTMIVVFYFKEKEM